MTTRRIQSLLALMGISRSGQLASHAAHGEYVRSQMELEQHLSRRGKHWTRDGDKLVLDGFPMITIRRSTPGEVAKTFGVGVFCVECDTLPPAFPSTLELAKSLGEERAQEIDALPLNHGGES
jgi:hypothetical protein